MGIDQRVLDLMYPRAERPVQPVERLACAVVHQAFADLQDSEPLLRRDAIRFFRGDSFETWGKLTPLNIEATRSRLVILRLVDEDGRGEAHHKRDAGRANIPTDAPSTSAARTADGLPVILPFADRAASHLEGMMHTDRGVVVVFDPTRPIRVRAEARPAGTSDRVAALTHKLMVLEARRPFAIPVIARLVDNLLADPREWGN
jgi:hypothetical protein